MPANTSIHRVWRPSHTSLHSRTPLYQTEGFSSDHRSSSILMHALLGAGTRMLDDAESESIDLHRIEAMDAHRVTTRPHAWVSTHTT